MSFRLVSESAIFTDLERRNGRVVCVISPNLVAFGVYYVKLVEDTPTHSASEIQPKEFSQRQLGNSARQEVSQYKSLSH